MRLALRAMATRKAAGGARSPASSKRAKVTVAYDEPPRWRTQLALIKQMRGEGGVAAGAAVDSMGCEKAMNAAGDVDERTVRFHILVSAMLSPQTKDQVTHAAMGRLRALRGGLTPATVAALDEARLAEVLHPVGMKNQKAKRLIAAAKTCLDEYGGDIPPTEAELVKLKGVGEKIAVLVMNVGWNTPGGVCVDVHVHRISGKLGWASELGHKKRTPEDTRKALEAWLPRNEWLEVNPLLVGFGQTVCEAKKPKCSDCLLSKDPGLCLAAFKDGPNTPSKKEE